MPLSKPVLFTLLLCERFTVSKKKIIEAKPTPIFETLLAAKEVRLTSNWLQSPPNILYQLFPREALARVKVQLQVLQDLLKMDTQYQIMEANNGTFWKIPVSA